ncbi:MAG: hypothetical protein JO307_09320 [Bryobacterales bacterium]|nr:hypothetical protein [Bryobacterales bacterium]MBV9399769.1 hypothetical protein [Bryobacterales bacterium]
MATPHVFKSGAGLAKPEWENNRQELQRVRRELEEVTAVASHDLREPLRMINLYTQYLLREYGGAFNNQAHEVARRIQDNVARMERLIQGVTEYSAPADKRFRATSLRKAAVRALEPFGARIESMGGTVEIGRLPLVLGDERQLQIVFRNLFSNSVKYAHTGRRLRIRIWGRRDGSIWTIYFSDNGIGFKPEFSQRIFGLFRRLHGREVPGTGLGLATSRQIIERHGGEIRAEGQPEKGATFIFTLKGFSRHAGRLANIARRGQSRRRFFV